MIHAAMAGKLACLDSEDALTAATFGRLRYLPPEVLRAWLDAAEPWPRGASLPGRPWADVREPPSVEFWPRWPEGPGAAALVEPDAVLVFGASAVIVEAKLWSGKSGASGDRDQIKRQWVAGSSSYFSKHHRSMTIAAHIYVTPHLTMPEADLAESFKSLVAAGISSPTLLWLPWSALAPPLEADSGNVIAADLLGYMREVGVLRFMGWKQPKPVADLIWRYSATPSVPYWAGVSVAPDVVRWRYAGAAEGYWRAAFPAGPARWRFIEEERTK